MRRPASQQQKAPEVQPPVLPELHAMNHLAKTMDRQVDQLDIVCSDDSKSKNESDPFSNQQLLLLIAETGPGGKSYQ